MSLDDLQVVKEHGTSDATANMKDPESVLGLLTESSDTSRRSHTRRVPRPKSESAINIMFRRCNLVRLCIVALGSTATVWIILTFLSGTPDVRVPARFATVSRSNGAPKKPDVAPDSTEKLVKVRVYGEAHCPDTTHFIEASLMPAWNALSRHMDLEYVPFGKANCVADGTDDHKCTCQHGAPECLMNAMQGCVIDRMKTHREYMPVIACLQGKDVSPSVAKECVPPTIGDMVECAKSPKGRRLLAKAGVTSKSDVGGKISYVPWVLVEGVREKKAMRDLKGLVCDKIEGKKPDECS